MEKIREFLSIKVTDGSGYGYGYGYGSGYGSGYGYGDLRDSVLEMEGEQNAQ